MSNYLSRVYLSAMTTMNKSMMFPIEYYIGMVASSGGDWLFIFHLSVV